jgi:deoxycytidine triphosphate deaminase
MKHVFGVNSKTTLSDVKDGDVQPNAVDLRLDKVFRIGSTEFVISNDAKQHRVTAAVLPDQDGYFYLEPGDYEVVMENIISVGEGEAGWVITRSTLNRNGVFLTSGLYDSGYHGVMAGCLHVGSGPMRIKQGTRIGQYLSFDSEALHKYNGSYGLNSEHDKKYEQSN